MRPTWQSECGTASLWLGDCLEIMAGWPDESIDSLTTDPPYCSGAVSEARRTSANGQGLRSENLIRFGWFVGDNMGTAGLTWLLRTVAIASQRAVKASGHFLCFCDWRMLSALQPAIESTGLRFQALVVWNKGVMGLGVGFRAQHELVMHFTYGAPDYHDRSFGNVLTCPRVGDERFHQTEKPVDVMQPLVVVTSPEGGLVADPFMGSGSTGIAAIRSGRRFWGIEKDPAHFETARRRCVDELGRFALFDAAPTQQTLFVG